MLKETETFIKNIKGQKDNTEKIKSMINMFNVARNETYNNIKFAMICLDRKSNIN